MGPEQFEPGLSWMERPQRKRRRARECSGPPRQENAARLFVEHVAERLFLLSAPVVAAFDLRAASLLQPVFRVDVEGPAPPCAVGRTRARWGVERPLELTEKVLLSRRS